MLIRDFKKTVIECGLYTGLVAFLGWLICPEKEGLI